MNALEPRRQYLEAGYDPIPLRHNSKFPLVKGWPTVPTFRQWERVTGDPNIGLRAGGGRAFIDCDEPQTFENVTRWLDGLGHPSDSLTVAQSASGVGRHVYVSWAGNLLGNYRIFRASVGKGEFRYGPGAYVAAPPSVVESSEYAFLQGDLNKPSALDMRDIAALVNLNEPTREPQKAPRMSALASQIARGHIPAKYATGSEAEQALILSLVNSGFGFDFIRSVFQDNACAGHYQRLKREKGQMEADRNLGVSYRNALAKSEHESRELRQIRDMRRLAQADSWRRESDRQIFLAHLDTAGKACHLEYAAAIRDLAMTAGITLPTAQNANKRLLKQGLVSILTPATANLATRYKLPTDTHPYTLPKYHPCEGVYKTEHPTEARENGHSLNLDTLEQSDAFRNGKGRLGRRAGHIYRLLFTEALQPREIAARVGIQKAAHVRKLLKRLATVKDHKTGEVLELVVCDGEGRWRSQVVDLELLEAIYGTRGARELQRMAYEKERHAHARGLELGALKN